MKLTVTTRDGAAHAVEGREGLSLMQNIRNAGIDELEAICGGSLSCATCHVYLERTPQGAVLPAESADEKELLEACDHRRPTSRLSCQLPCDATFAGLEVTVAPED
jgi:2Fe-2S ferredoxin